jgi:hypothetical protein
MEKVRQLIQDPAFWVGGVVITLVVNILSAYIKDRLDKQWAAYSEGRRQKLQSEDKKREQRLAAMVQHVEMLEGSRHFELRLRFHVIGVVVINAAVWTIGSLGLTGQPLLAQLCFLSLQTLALAWMVSVGSRIKRVSREVNEAMGRKIRARTQPATQHHVEPSNAATSESSS